ncbi:MAG: NAD(P)-dependent alcohol dehydrogenase [Candidatus Zixiibacteriota bacterium]
MIIRAYAAGEPKAKLAPFEYESRPLGPHDVAIAISHCGICHSDIHLWNNDWGLSQYPLVPGHEIAGTVIDLGHMVRGLDVGSRVGVGWQCGACLECEWCASGHDNLCPNGAATCVGNYGGYADAIVVDSRYAFLLSDRLTSASAAPLMCGGITVYSPLRQLNVQPHMKVGVVGIGGLGHLALQFARAFGCEVTAFSSSPDKQSDARHFGAHHFVNSTDPKDLGVAAGSQDVLIVTANVELDWLACINVLRPMGHLCFVGAVPKPVSIPAMALIVGNKSVSGSPIGSRQAIRDMLEFAARHNIVARTELMPMSQVNEALAKVAANQARYRVVLQN